MRQEPRDQVQPVEPVVEDPGARLARHCEEMNTAATKLLARTELKYNDCDPSKCWMLVQTVFNMLGCPAEFDASGRSCWDGSSGVINTIRDYLFLGRGWRRRRTIRRVLEYIREKIDGGDAAESIDILKMHKRSTGRKRKMTAEMDRCVAKCLNKGFGMQLTTAIVNTKATKVGSPTVHISTMYRSARTAFNGECHNRPLKKTGCRDLDSIWCRARLSFALQLEQQFRHDVAGDSMVGKRVVKQFEDDNGELIPFVGKIISFDPAEKYYKVHYDADDDEEELVFSQLLVPNWTKIPRLSVLWCDEKHKKVVIGPSNRHEWLFFVDPNNPDVFMSQKDGGVRQQPRASTRAKYMKECRGLFGVMAVEQTDGTCIGKRMKPFNYTGRKVVGPVNFEKRVNAEVRRVANLKTTGTSRSPYWKDAGAGLPGGPYEARYGDTWREEVKERLGKGSDPVCNVTDLMDHVIEQGNILFADTPYHDSWVVYHDALSAWWSEGAQQHLQRKRFRHRQVKGLGFTNAGTRYEDSLPGDTPEYMPLDSNLFSDLEKMVRWNVAATNEMPRGHPDKFDLTTPASAWSAVSRTWEHAPTSERIVEDINRVFNAIEEVLHLHRLCPLTPPPPPSPARANPTPSPFNR